MVTLTAHHLEEATKRANLLKQLDSIALGRMYEASFKAVVRLHVFFTGRTQELLLEFGEKAQALILKKAAPPRPSPNGRKERRQFGEGEMVLDGTSGLIVQMKLMEMWEETMSTWRAEFEQARVEAVAIPFGVLAVMHERLVVEAVSDQRLAVSKAEGGRREAEGSEQLSVISEAEGSESTLTPSPSPDGRGGFEEGVKGGVFNPQLQRLVDVAAERIYGDGINLSARIWKLDQESREGINRVLFQGIADGDSAWNIAKQLEQFLGANEDCPRWTSTRLYGRTKSQIASGDVTGLLRGDECDGSGVAYNALRLARTEIQKAHALATDKILMSQPWVKQERVRLSPAHAGSDVCDDVASGGENGDGIYPVGTIGLPLHPNCLCYKDGVLIPQKEFISKLRGWMDGTQEWEEMDDYADLLTVGGVEVQDSILPSALSLAVWLFGDKLEEWLK